MSKQKLLRIKLTPEQKSQLAPMFNELKKADKKGSPGAIIAQIWQDGLVASVLSNKKAAALNKAWGGKSNPEPCKSSTERIRDN